MNQNRESPASVMALGGVLAAAAVVIMSLGGLIPVATYVSPMLCAILLQVVLLSCGTRIAWAWYGAVAMLAVLLSPDKEAAAVFLFLGYYPILKPFFDGRRLRWLWKVVFFNGNIVVMYWLLLRLMGLEQLTEDFQELGIAGLVMMLAMGNLVFFLLDRLMNGKVKR